jgi:hypothetical protein
VVGLGMEFVRDLVLEMRCEGMPWKGGPHSKTQHVVWMGRYMTYDVSHDAAIPRNSRNPSIRARNDRQRQVVIRRSKI